MWLKNRSVASLILATVIASSSHAADPPEPTGTKPVTPEMEKICATAEQRYADLFPNAKDEAGVVVVKLYKYTFCPSNLTVKPGTTVRWVNVDRRTSHSVWLKQANTKESERFFPEEQWSFTFASPGKYPYLCGPHWKQENMYGHVTVTP